MSISGDFTKHSTQNFASLSASYSSHQSPLLFILLLLLLLFDFLSFLPFSRKKKKKESSLANILHQFNSSVDSLPGCLVCLRVREEPGKLDAGRFSFGKAFLFVFQVVFLIHVSVPRSSPPHLRHPLK